MKSSIIIPTVDRDELLVRAIEGVLKQQIVGAFLEVIIIDNSLDGRQSHVVAPFVLRTDPKFAVRYVHEPRSGLAHARNRGIEEADGEYIAFLDDDETPISDIWLRSLTDALINTGADVSFGPVTPQFETSSTRFENFAKTIYSRDLGRRDNSDVTNLINNLGTGNSCFKKKSCFGSTGTAFNEEFNNTGGEDIDLLRRLRANGKRFVWVPTAAVYEFVPTSRLSSKHLSSRRFQQGQQRSYSQIASTPRRYDALIVWMAIGVLQALFYSAARLVSLTMGKKDSAEIFKIRTWGGLGKVFWQAQFRRQHYGIPITD